MYTGLKLEMFFRKITIKEIAELLQISGSEVTRKLCNSNFEVHKFVKIKKEFFESLTFDELMV